MGEPTGVPTGAVRVQGGETEGGQLASVRARKEAMHWRGYRPAAGVCVCV